MVPNLTHGEKSWIIYGKTTDKATESYNFDTVSLASRHGHKIVTYSRHIEAVRLDIKLGGDGTGAKHRLKLLDPA